MNVDPELLIGLSHGELEALVEGVLALGVQPRLNELLARNEEHRLSAEEEAQPMYHANLHGQSGARDE